MSLATTTGEPSPFDQQRISRAEEISEEHWKQAAAAWLAKQSPFVRQRVNDGRHFGFRIGPNRWTMAVEDERGETLILPWVEPVVDASAEWLPRRYRKDPPDYDLPIFRDADPGEVTDRENLIGKTTIW